MTVEADYTVNGSPDSPNPTAQQKPVYEFKPEDEYRPGDILIGKEQIAEMVKYLAATIYADYKDRKLVLLTALKGATVFAEALKDELRKLGLTDFEEETLEVHSYRGIQSTGELNWVKEPDPEIIKDSDVLIVEDIIDTGLSLKGMNDRIDALGPKTRRSVSLLDKPVRRLPGFEEIKADYTGFEIDDHFVVGYGLDYEQNFREHDVIWIYAEGMPPDEHPLLTAAT